MSAPTALPGWLRGALFGTAAMNVLVGLMFASGSETLLAAAGFPAAGHPFYSLTVGLFIVLFGVGYLCAALADRPERLFIVWTGAGKIAFVVLVTLLFLAGQLPFRAPLLASADLAFGAAFVGWFLSTRGSS
jgi:hypothetical protein